MKIGSDKLGLSCAKLRASLDLLGLVRSFLNLIYWPSFTSLAAEMEYCASAASMLAEEILQIAEGIVEVLHKYVGSI